MTIRLFVLSPSVVFQGRINQASTVYPAAQFAYDGVTVGTYSVVYLNQTVLVGSTAGAFDLGITRVRKYPTSNTMYIGLSSEGTRRGEVRIVDNAWVTILDSFDVWSKTPFIDADGTQFMDADIPYTDENESPGPMANAGVGFCGTIDPITEVITVTFDSANSYATATGETIASVLWEIADGTLVSGTLADASITATFPGGMRWVTLTVADTAANEHKCHVPVFARDPDDDDSIENFQITRHTIGIDGQELDIRLLEDLPEATYPDGTLVMLWQDEPQTADDREHMLFIGWIQNEDSSIEATDTGLLRDTTLHCVDVAGRMKSLPGFSQVLTHTDSPTKWSEYPSPSIDRMILFLLQWQTTALDLADFFQSGTGSTFAFAELYADGSNLWDQVDRKAQSIMPDRRLTCNRAGQLKVLPDPMIAETADRVSTSQANITIDDWQALSFQQQRHPRTYWLRANAIQAGTTTPPTALFAIAPGTSPGQGSAETTVSENLAVSQTTLNQAAGHHYARLNAPQGFFSVTLPTSNNAAYDPARMDWVTLSISAATAAQRGLTFSEARFLLHQLDVRYNYGRGGVTRTNTLKLERETVGIPAVTYVPAVAEQPTDDAPFTPPDTPDAPPDFDGGLSATPQNIALITDDGRTIRTSNFGDSPPTWTVDNSAAASISGSGLSFVVNPFSPLYRTGSGTVDGFYVTTSGIYKLVDLFGTTSATLLHTFAEAISTSGGRWRSIACSFGRYESVEGNNPWIMVSSAYNSGITTRQGTWIIYSRDAGATWSAEIQVSAFKPTGSFSARYWPVIWMSPRTPGRALVIAKTQTGTLGGTGVFETTDWGATWAAYTPLVTSPQVTDGGLGGGGLHIPWDSNADESIVYHAYEVEASAAWERYLHRNTAGTVVDVTPSAGNYGPRWGLFGIRSYDGDRNYLCLAGARSNADDDILTESAGAFLSDDAGATWTQVLGPTTTAANAQYVAQAAFSGTDPNVVYFWGNEGFVYFTSTFGASMEDKRGSMSFTGGESILAICGGDA